MPDKGATHQRVKCSTPIRMIEGISAVEVEVDPNKSVMVGRLKSVTPPMASGQERSQRVWQKGESSRRADQA